MYIGKLVCQFVKLPSPALHTCWYIVTEHLRDCYDQEHQLNGQNLNCVHLCALSVSHTALKSLHLISAYSINTWSLTLKGSFQFQPVMDGPVWGRGRDDEFQSEGSSGTVINGVLPETSATQLSIIRQAEKPSEGKMVSVMRSLADGGHPTPFEVFITVFCHYMIKVIAGWVGAF